MMNMGKKEVRERLAMLGDVSQTQKSNSQHHRLSSISSSPQENSLPSASFTPNSTNLIHTFFECFLVRFCLFSEKSMPSL